MSRKLHFFKHFSAGFISALLIFPGVTSAKMNGFYKEGQEGWFWYQDPAPVETPKKEKEKPKKKEPSVVVMDKPKDGPPSPSPESKKKGPEALSAAWFRGNLQKYMDKAIDDPTPENVEAYFLLQRVMMDKAETFSKVAGRVVVGDKILDETNRMSLDGGTVNKATRVARENSEEAITKISESAGLFFFFSKDCALCGEQARILAEFERRFGTRVQPVSLDGSVLGNQKFAERTLSDQGQAEMLGVESGSPSLYLAVPPEEWIPISFGVVNQNQIMERMLLAADESRMLTEEEFGATRAVKPNNSLSKTLDGKEELPDDPKELIELLRSLEK